MRQPRIVDVVPAILTPFKDDYSIDTDALQSHADKLASIDGVGTIFCTGHAGEVASLNRKERQLVTSLVVEAVRGRMPVIAGIYTDSLDEAVDFALDAKKVGASAATLFPPPTFADGANDTSEMPYLLFKTVIERSQLPLVVFQFPPSSGLGYSTETLCRLATLPEVVAVKEGSSDMTAYERNVRALAKASPPVPVLTSNNSWLMPSLCVGGDGILSGSGNFLAAQHVELWRAVQRQDLAEARRVNDRLYPVVEMLYRPPFINVNTRIKEALVLMGLLKRATVRPPLLPLSETERQAVAEALTRAHLI